MKGWEFSETVRDKAARYVAEGRVTQDSVHETVWWVQGSDDARRYRVQTDATPERPRMTRIHCTCKFGLETGSGLVTCSHAVAVAMTIVK